jgi:hypothetical protein
VQQADPGLEPERWHAPPEALDWVRDVLRAALAGPHPDQARAAVRARWWRPLWPDAYDPADQLDAELMAVACEHLEGARRDQLVRDIQEWTFARTAGQAHPSTVAWNIAFGTRVPGMSDAALFLAGLVERNYPVSSEVGAQLAAVLEAQPALSAHALWTINQLCRQGHPLPARLAGLRTIDGAVVHADGFEVRTTVMVDSLLAATRETAPAVLAVLSGCSGEVAKPLLEELMARWPRHAGAATAAECRAVAFSFVLATDHPGTEDMRDHLAKLVAAMPPGVRTAVERSYPGGLGQRWWDWVATVAPSRWRLRRRSGTRSAARTGERSE